MAVTENSYTGNGSTTNYSFTFPYLKSTDVQVQVDATVTTAWQFANATTVQFNTAPANGAKIKILRDTNVDSLAATFYAGSSIKSEDLNDNYTQNLYKTQEVGNRYFSTTGGTMTGDLTLGEDVTLTFEGATDNANETKLTVADPTADRTITFPDTTGTVVTTGDTGTVATGMIAADAVNGTKIADDSINSEHYVDGSIDTQHIADLNVTTAKIAHYNVTTVKIADANVTGVKLAADSVNGTKIADDSINSEHYVDGSIDTQHIADNQITTAKIVNDAVTADKLANTSVTAGTYSAADITVDAQGRVTAASSGAIATSEITDGAVTTAKINDAAVTTAKIADANVTTAKIANDAITENKIADDAVTLAQIADAAVRTNHIADLQVTTPKIASDAVTTAKLANTNVTDAKLASNSVTTSKITDANVTTAKVADSNITLAKLASDLKQTTISDSDTQLPTSGAVVDYVAAQIAPLGGLEVVATEVAFPNTQPSSGVVISISDAGGVVVNGSGVSTTGRTVGGTTVTINGFPSSLQSSTLAAGIGLLVSSTGSSQTYNYHKILGKEADITALSDDINDFNNRYRTGGSAPTSSLDNGDLWFDTTNGKMMVYNSTNTAWEEVSAVGSFNINTLSSSGSTGGGSATFNGTAYRFTLSNPPQDAQQLLVSINGVIQKPNSGTSQPSEGFAISGNDIIFSAAPNSGAPFFIVTLGQSVQIGAPSDGSVTTAKLTSGAVTTAKIADDAVTADKIGTLTGNVDFNDSGKARFGASQDLEVYHDGTHSHIREVGTGDLRLRSDKLLLMNQNSEEYFVGTSNGAAELYYDDSKKLETNASGVRVVGTLNTGNGATISFSDNVNLEDSTATQNNRVKLGGGDDLHIYHDGTDSLLKQFTATPLKIQGVGSNGADVHIQARPDEEGIKLLNNSGESKVEIYYNGVKTFHTKQNGIVVEGTEGAGAVLEIRADEGDDNNDLHRFFADGSTSNLYFQNFASGSWETNLRTIGNGTTELWYDNSKKFETTSYGALVTGTMSAGTGNFDVGDNGMFKAGNSSDLQIYHDTTHSYIYNQTGELKNRAAIWKVVNAANSEIQIKATENAGVELYYDANKKFETFTNGIKVIGPSVDAGGGAASGNIQMLHTDGRKNTIGNNFATNSYDSRIEFGVSDGSTSGGTNRIASLSYAGMSFGTDTASANRLDDYEEGSWTPTLQGTTTAGTANITYAARTGKYVKIGKKVFWQLYLNFSNGDGSGTFHITGLPYTVANDGTYPAVNIGYVQQFSLRSNHHLYGLHASGSSYIYFYEMPDGGGSNVQPNYDGSGSLIMSGHYEVG